MNISANCKATKSTLPLRKPLNAHIDYAKALASSVNGQVMNVVDVKTTLDFETATVNFYMPGITSEQNIQVYQYVNGEWVSLNISEIKEDHLLLDITAPGILAIIEVQ